MFKVMYREVWQAPIKKVHNYSINKQKQINREHEVLNTDPRHILDLPKSHSAKCK